MTNVDQFFNRWELVYLVSKASWYIPKSESILSRDLSNERSTVSPCLSLSMTKRRPSTVLVWTSGLLMMWILKMSSPISHRVMTPVFCTTFWMILRSRGRNMLRMLIISWQWVCQQSFIIFKKTTGSIDSARNWTRLALTWDSNQNQNG